jgi:hypothetical protein
MRSSLYILRGCNLVDSELYIPRNRLLLFFHSFVSINYIIVRVCGVCLCCRSVKYSTPKARLDGAIYVFRVM